MPGDIFYSNLVQKRSRAFVSLGIKRSKPTGGQKAEA
jgi:hypothetical protein